MHILAYGNNYILDKVVAVIEAIILPQGVVRVLHLNECQIVGSKTVFDLPFELVFLLLFLLHEQKLLFEVLLQLLQLHYLLGPLGLSVLCCLLVGFIPVACIVLVISNCAGLQT